MKFFFTFDPFEENKWNRNQMKSLVTVLSDSGDKLSAVYVATKAATQLTTAYDVPEKERFSEYPKTLMGKELNKLGLASVEPKVVTELSLSQSAAVEKLNALAKKEKADMIIISTNAKSLLPRLIFGSFAETLVHKAKCDLMVYHQKTKVGSSRPKIFLYAHDLTAKGDAGLERAVVYAEKWQAKLIVLHVSPEDVIAKAETKMKKLEKMLAQKNIKFEMNLLPYEDDIATTVMELAASIRANFIAVAAGSDAEPLLGGSVVRNILRQSKIPTLVLKI